MSPITEVELDAIYTGIDKSLREGRFNDIDLMLAVMTSAAPNLHVDLILALLTATLPAHSKLPSRAAFFAEAERVLRTRVEWDEGLLVGLAGDMPSNMINDWIRFYRNGGRGVGIVRGLGLSVNLAPSVVIGDPPFTLTHIVFRLWLWRTDYCLRIRYR